MTSHLRFSAVVGLLVVFSTHTLAQVGVDSSHQDFGAVPKGTILTHDFTITNRYREPLHVAGLRTSCGCATATMKSATIAPGETESLHVNIDTNKYSGDRTFTIYALFDRPTGQEIRLQARAFSREDLVVSPAALNFGSIRKGSENHAHLVVKRYSSSNWSILGIDNDNGFIQTKLEKLQEGSGIVSYRLSANLREDTPAGRWHADLWLRTNDPATPRIRVPLSVEITGLLTAMPNTVSFGRLPKGVTKQKKVVIRGEKPFCITALNGTDECCQVRGDQTDQKKTVHILNVDFAANIAPGPVQRNIQVVTDLESDKEVEFIVQAHVID